MNVLLSIGCDSYSHTSALCSAERDAKDVYTILLQGSQHYSPDVSQCLLSPTVSEATAALDKSFPAGENIDVFTFFFAGHAGVKAGSFFLCMRDSDPERMSTTAFPIISLFTLINEFRPSQVNIVIDACEAGGSCFDLTQLLKPEVVGSSGASSITFLGACSSDELAAEDETGGKLTRALIKCIAGDQEVQSKSPFLDLTDVGATVSRLIQADQQTQKPIFWGLNLFGNGRFAKNPHFDAKGTGRVFPVESVSPLCEFGKQIRAKSQLLWDEYRLIKDDPNPRRLLDLLDSVCVDAGTDTRSMIAFVRGIGRNLSVRADESSEMFAASQCLGACAVSLLPMIDNNEVRLQVPSFIHDMMALDARNSDKLLRLVREEKYGLLGETSPTGELFYLPLRITKILGWIGLSVILEDLFPVLRQVDNSHHFALASGIVQRYGNSIVAVSDEQAASIYLFVHACLKRNEEKLATQVTNLLFASFADRRANVARVETDGAGAFRYILSLGSEEFRPKDWQPVNASLLLPVLLVCGAKLSLGSTWDLRAFDRKFSTFFVPSDYRQFGRKIIEPGMNYSHHIGFGVWTVSEFKKEFDAALAESLGPEIMRISKEGVALSTIASLLFPDRIPFLLERTLQEQF